MQPAPRGRGAQEDATPGGGRADEADLRRRLTDAESTLEQLKTRFDATEGMAGVLAEQRNRLDAAEAERGALADELERVRARRVFRYTDKAWRLGAQLRDRVRGNLAETRPPFVGATLVPPTENYYGSPGYDTWVSMYDQISDVDRDRLRQRLAALDDPPLVSVILPVFNTPEPYLRAALDSLRAQLYKHWELCVVDDASTAAWIRPILEEYAAADARIKVQFRTVNGHISAASNTALAMAVGPWLCLFDHDDVMAEHALALAILALAEQPTAGLLYSDEDHLYDDGTRASPYFKPDFDPLLLLGQNYLAHLCMIRRDLVEAVGGWRIGYEGSQDWDLMLRVSEQIEPDQVVHVPHVLYHWRAHAGSTAGSLAAKPYAVDAARRSVDDHLERTGSHGRSTSVGRTGYLRVHWDLPDPLPTVSVVVIARNGGRFVRLIDSLRLRSTYPGVEIVVLDDGYEHQPLRRYLQIKGDDLTVVRVEGDPTDAVLRNAGARAASGEVLCFLDDDVEVLNEGWLEEMIGLLVQPGVGAVGAKLYYHGGGIQHAGVITGIGKTVGHVQRFSDRLEPGYFARALLTQSFSAVSGACLAVRREAFFAIGGFDEEHFTYVFSDLDLCLRLGEKGWRIGWTPYAEMEHHQSPQDTRLSGDGLDRAGRDIRFLHERWGSRLEWDPAYNPNLTLAHETFSLAWPPRADWRQAGAGSAERTPS